MSSGTQGFHSDWERQREALSALLDDELDVTQRRSLEGHLAECEQCRTELASLRRTRALLRAMPQPPLPRSFTLPVETAASVRSISAAPSRSRQRETRSGALPRLAQRVGSLAAAVGLVLLIGTWITGISNGGPSTASSARTTSGGASAQNTNITAAGDRTHTPPAYVAETRAPEVSSPSTASSTGAATSTASNHTQPSGDTASSVPVAPLAGAGLTIGGVLLVIAGRATKARQERRRVTS